MNQAFRRVSLAAPMLLAWCALACGSGDGDDLDDSAGGSSASGGSHATGGSSATGGSGGSLASGGSGTGGASTGGASTGGSSSTGGSGSGGSGNAGSGGTANPDPIDLDNPGVWIDITPPVTKPYADGGSFYYGFGWIEGAKPGARGTLYVGLDHNHDADAGVWKTTDAGATWTLTDPGPDDGLKACAQPIQVDSTNPDIVYAGSIKAGVGLLKSTDGGDSWVSTLPSDVEHDIYYLSMDPENSEHLLLTFHSAGGNWNGNAGVLETTNGGADWDAIPADGWTGAGQFSFFIGRKNDGAVDTEGAFWLVATQYDGIFRTEDAGDNWDKVADFDMTHGMEQLYRAPNDTLYLGSVGKIFRSTDNGKTWSDTGAQSSGDGYGGIIGDDTQVWTMLSNTGAAAFGPYKWQTLPIDDTTSSAADSHWEFFGDETYAAGPNHMAYDPENRIVYAANWGTGVWRYQLPD